MPEELEIKIAQAAKLVAAEEVARNPAALNQQNLEGQIIQQWQQSQAAREASASWLVNKLEGIQQTIVGGGIKSIIARGIFYILIPMILVAAGGYLIYRAFTSRKVFLEFLSSMNSSAVYQDNTTRWRIRIRELVPNVQEDEDRKRFEEVKAKMAEVWKAKPEVKK